MTEITEKCAACQGTGETDVRIIPGKNGKGFAYVRGNGYPVEGPGDGTRFETAREAEYHYHLTRSPKR